MKELVDQIKAEYEVFAKRQQGSRCPRTQGSPEHHEDDEGFQKGLSRECKINLSQAFTSLRDSPVSRAVPIFLRHDGSRNRTENLFHRMQHREVNLHL